MPLTVTNLSGHMIALRLRSGGALHLGPGESTAELPDAEIRDNPHVAGLVERRLVGVDEVARPAKKAARPSTSKSGSGTEAVR